MVRNIMGLATFLILADYVGESMLVRLCGFDIHAVDSIGIGILFGIRLAPVSIGCGFVAVSDCTNYQQTHYHM